MKSLSFMTICLYYYGREILRNPGYTLVLLAVLFVTHKLASWTAWMNPNSCMFPGERVPSKS